MTGSGQSVVVPLWQAVLPFVLGPFMQHTCFNVH